MSQLPRGSPHPPRLQDRGSPLEPSDHRTPSRSSLPEPSDRRPFHSPHSRRTLRAAPCPSPPSRGQVWPPGMARGVSVADAGQPLHAPRARPQTPSRPVPSREPSRGGRAEPQPRSPAATVTAATAPGSQCRRPGTTPTIKEQRSDELEVSVLLQPPTRPESTVDTTDTSDLFSWHGTAGPLDGEHRRAPGRAEWPQEDR